MSDILDTIISQIPEKPAEAAPEKPQTPEAAPEKPQTPEASPGKPADPASPKRAINYSPAWEAKYGKKA